MSTPVISPAKTAQRAVSFDDVRAATPHTRALPVRGLGEWPTTT